jgi:Ca2+-binding EF-hand superfamily protein
MRIKFVVLSVLMGSLALLLGSTPGRTQFPDDLQGHLPAGDVPDAAPDAFSRVRLPADVRDVAPQSGGAGANLLGTGREGGPPDPHAWMDERFRLLDRDGDGLLSYDEMTENLKAEKDKWDVNRDGRIDLMEWREYVTAFLAQQRSAADAADRARPRGGKDQTHGQRPRAPSRGLREPGTVPSPLRGRAGNTHPGQNAGPPPPTIAVFRGQVGKVFSFQVTGVVGGGIWGTDVYTDDSLVATAAVHAGVLRAGETGVVKVTILPPQAAYYGTTRNGVTSGGFAAFPGSYRLERRRGDRARREPLPRAVPLPPNLPPWFKEYDTDGDGQVALHEWKARNGSVEEFQKLDLDGDGFITVQEAMHAAPTPTRRNNVPVWFKEYDTDGDGQISLSEWKDRHHSVEDFQKADLDHDGFITADELLRAGYIQAPRPQVLMLSSSEREYLRNLDRRTSWIYVGSDPLREGLRRLRAMGLIETPKANLYEMWDGHKVNLHDFARITERGRQFLRVRPGEAPKPPGQP